jgi:23S rRNA pseudouridine1911/1915/1917 synthase
MMGAPAGRDKDAVFKHKRVVETKAPPVSPSKRFLGGLPNHAACQSTRTSRPLSRAVADRLSRRTALLPLPIYEAPLIMSTISTQAIHLRAEVPFALGGQRLDQVAAQLFSEHSRSRLAAWIKDGLLTVDGAALRPRDTVHAGAVLELSAEQQAQGEWVAQDIPLDIVFEDEHILVLNKPSGLVVHPAAGHADGTLLNALLHHVPDIINVPRAGIVHRLDKDTTGLMVVA